MRKHQILRTMGLVETMCFILTNDYGHWYVEDNQIYFKNRVGPVIKSEK